MNRIINNKNKNKINRIFQDNQEDIILISRKKNQINKKKNIQFT